MKKSGNATMKCKKELARIKPKLRWMFGDILPMQEIFGMYLIEKGQNFKTRVTLIAKVCLVEIVG